MDGAAKELYNLIRGEIVRVETDVKGELKALGIVLATFNSSNQQAMLSSVQRLTALETKVDSHDRLLWMLGGGLVATMVGVAVAVFRIWFL